MLLISSMGGCASTMIVNWFSRRTACNCPRNSEGLSAPGPGGNHLGLKHRIAPPEEYEIPRHENSGQMTDRPRRITRAVFVYDDPRVIVLSLFDRGIAAGHAMAITGENPLHRNNLEDFLARGVDSFGFHEQFRNWSDSQVHRPYSRMLVKGSEFWNCLPDVLSFAGLPEEMQREFPPQRARTDRYGSLETGKREQLEAIYGSLISRMDEFPDKVVI